MKKAAPTFGTIEVDYQLDHILKYNHAEFIKSETLRRDLLKTNDGSPASLERTFQARQAAIRYGVITVFSAVAFLEQTIYKYGTKHFDADSFEEHVGGLSVVAKWIIVPRLCKGLAVDETATAINDLRELVRARNCVIHPKVKWMSDSSFEHKHKSVRKEGDRFTHAAEKAIDTVNALLVMLNAPISEEA